MPPETDPSDPAAGAPLPADPASGAAAPAAPEAEAATAAPQSTAAAEAPEPPAAAASSEPGQPLPPAVPEMTAAVCAARLAELFPALFAADGPPRPVKLRVHADVQQRAPGVFTRRVLSTFLARHTTTSAYLRALVESPHRFDLDGQPAGEIADEHRQAAREELARRRALRRGPPANARRQAGVDTPPPTGPGLDTAASPEAPAAERPPRGARPEGGTRTGHPARGSRPDRPDRPDRPGRASRPNRPNRLNRPNRPDQPNRPDRTEAAGQPAGQPPRGRPQQPGRPSRPQQRPATDARAPAAPFDPAQRARLALVRAWESSPLTKPNFCALMRVSAAELDAAIEQVQQERRARADVRPAR